MMNKIINRFELLLFCGMVLLTAPATAQEIKTGHYGLKVITSPDQLLAAIETEPAKAMRNLKKDIPGLVFDLRYATNNNFMHRKLYPRLSTSWLRVPAADSLKSIQQAFQQLGLGLKIFDAYRPYSVTVIMWDAVKDDRYAADPKKGSGHNRGIAVDLTLVDLATKKELDMGTGFDNFTDTAHSDFTHLPQTVLHNRSLLKDMMIKHGFKPLETEWWHYSLESNTEFELMNLGFANLKKLDRKQKK